MHEGSCGEKDGSFVFATSGPSADVAAVQLKGRSGPPATSIGGPFVAVGGSFRDGFRTRVGWDFGLQRWLMASPSIETDFSSTVGAAVVAQVVGRTFPAPWWGLGAGPVGFVGDETRGGARAQLNVHLFLLGLAFNVDVLDRGPPRPSLLGTIAF